MFLLHNIHTVHYVLYNCEQFSQYLLISFQTSHTIPQLPRFNYYTFCYDVFTQYLQTCYYSLFQATVSWSINNSLHYLQTRIHYEEAH